MKKEAIFEGFAALIIEGVVIFWVFSEGEKDGQGTGGELLKMLLENRRGMAIVARFLIEKVHRCA